MTRQKIYELLEEERCYQDSRFGREFDELNSIGHWIIYIEEYLSQAKKKFFGSRIPGGADISYPVGQGVGERAVMEHAEHRREILKKVKSIASLCIACLEYLGEDTGLER